MVAPDRAAPPGQALLQAGENPPAAHGHFGERCLIQLAQRLCIEHLGGRPGQPAAIAIQQQHRIREARGERRIVQDGDHGATAIGLLLEEPQQRQLLLDRKSVV